MPIRRSDTMRAVDAVQPLVDQFNALDDSDKLTFLDLVDPLPDKTTHSHKQKKSSKKGAGSRSQIVLCVECKKSATSIVHTDDSLDDYHQFVSPPSSKSRRASSLQQQIQKTTRTNGSSGQCTFIVNDATGEMCGATMDDAIHDATYLSSHVFQPAAVTHHAASGGRAG